jgi:hypothetical protein
MQDVELSMLKGPEDVLNASGGSVTLLERSVSRYDLAKLPVPDRGRKTILSDGATDQLCGGLFTPHVHFVR